ncbi:hypothetical protein [Leptospira interrogans]|uniref:hypothetical protein n=1 Tax=Leptospira interrogans TaxID=173 RepID=UPI0013A07DB5
MKNSYALGEAVRNKETKKQSNKSSDVCRYTLESRGDLCVLGPGNERTCKSRSISRRLREGRGTTF